jgi:hypothetical protein
MLHGDQDELVPYELGQTLLRQPMNRKNFLPFEGPITMTLMTWGERLMLKRFANFLKRYLKEDHKNPSDSMNRKNHSPEEL